MTHDVGEAGKRSIMPDFKRSVKGAKITSDVGMIMLRALDERFGIIAP